MQRGWPAGEADDGWMAVKAGAHFPQAGVFRQKIASRYGNLHSAGAGWAAWAWHTAVCGLEVGEQGRRDVHVCLSHTNWKLNTPSSPKPPWFQRQLIKIEIIYPEWEHHKPFSS